MLQNIRSILLAALIVAVGTPASAQNLVKFIDAATGKAVFVDNNLNKLPTTGSAGGGAGDASAANQAIQITAEQAVQAVLGSQANSTACASDAAACTVQALLQRIAQRNTSIINALGSPFQAGGSIGNTAFGISGTLPAFASTPTFNIGTIGTAASAANQSTMITSLGTIVTNTTGLGTHADFVTANGYLATISSLGLAQNSTTSGQLGILSQCATLTAHPTFTTAKTNPLWCNPNGGLATTLYDAAGNAVDLSLGADSTNSSSTITAGGTFQTVQVQTATRKGCLIQNPTAATELLYVYMGTGTATTAKAFELPAGAAFACAGPGGMVDTALIQITAATTGHVYKASLQ